MKQDAVFMNLSRCFIDVNALHNHLKSGHLSGAAVDVFPTEPKTVGDEFSTPLTEIANVILTPHVGGSTLEAQEAIGEFVSHKLYDYYTEGNTSLSVNMPQLNVEARNSRKTRDGEATSTSEKITRIAHLHTNLPGMLAQILLARCMTRILLQWKQLTALCVYILCKICSTFLASLRSTCN